MVKNNVIEGPEAEAFIAALCQEKKFIIPKIGDIFGTNLLILSKPYGHRVVNAVVDLTIDDVSTDVYQKRAWVEMDCLYIDRQIICSHRHYWWQYDWDTRGEAYYKEQADLIASIEP